MWALRFLDMELQLRALSASVGPRGCESDLDTMGDVLDAHGGWSI